jgi:hypothetical protein
MNIYSITSDDLLQNGVLSKCSIFVNSNEFVNEHGKEHIASIRGLVLE